MSPIGNEPCVHWSCVCAVVREGEGQRQSDTAYAACTNGPLVYIPGIKLASQRCVGKSRIRIHATVTEHTSQPALSPRDWRSTTCSLDERTVAYASLKLLFESRNLQGSGQYLSDLTCAMAVFAKRETFCGRLRRASEIILDRNTHCPVQTTQQRLKLRGRDQKERHHLNRSDPILTRTR